MPFERDSERIVIAGASSLLGIELKSLLEESRFAGWDFRLVDEEPAAGILTEAGGEAAVIQPVEEDSFSRAKFVFFTGSAEFTRANIAAAKQAKAKIIDLSGGVVDQPGTVAWFPGLDALNPRGSSSQDSAVYAIPSASATAAASLTLGLSALGLRRLAVICFQPVSDVGRKGIEELEGQTSQLLSFQNIGKPVFDTQVAFTLLDRFGGASSEKLAAVRERVRAETRVCLTGQALLPSVQVLHAPVFYGTTFVGSADFDAPTDVQSVAKMCQRAGFAISEPQEGPSSVSVAGESVMQLSEPEPDSLQPGTVWIWGAADNIRLPAANAIKLADKLAQ